MKRPCVDLLIHFRGRYPQIQVHAWRVGKNKIAIAVRTVNKRSQEFIDGHCLVLPKRGALMLAAVIQRLCAEAAKKAPR